jgi:hypothetical protein
MQRSLPNYLRGIVDAMARKRWDARTPPRQPRATYNPCHAGGTAAAPVPPQTTEHATDQEPHPV